MSKEYSKKELQLLYELSNNSRTPLNQIAKKLHSSQQSLNYKVKQFQEQGTIIDFYTIFDSAFFDLDCFRVYFRINYSKYYDSFLQQLLIHESIISITPCAGKWDLIVLFACKNASKFSKLLSEISNKFPNIIENIEILLTSSTYGFGRKYLIEHSSHLGTLIYGGDRTSTNLDSMDRKILLELFESTRSPYIKIALKLKLNPKTLINKIRSLEARGIIKGYSLNLDCSKFDYLSYKILLKYSNYSNEENELIKYSRQNKNILRLTKTIGYWNIEMDTEVKDTFELNNIITDLKRKFTSFIFDIDSIQTFRPTKISYLPKSFFIESH